MWRTAGIGCFPGVGSFVSHGRGATGPRRLSPTSRKTLSRKLPPCKGPVRLVNRDVLCGAIAGACGARRPGASIGHTPVAGAARGEVGSWEDSPLREVTGSALITGGASVWPTWIGSPDYSRLKMTPDGDCSRFNDVSDSTSGLDSRSERAGRARADHFRSESVACVSPVRGCFGASYFGSSTRSMSSLSRNTFIAFIRSSRSSADASGFSGARPIALAIREFSR